MMSQCRHAQNKIALSMFDGAILRILFIEGIRVGENLSSTREDMQLLPRREQSRASTLHLRQIPNRVRCTESAREKRTGSGPKLPVLDCRQASAEVQTC